MAVVVAQMCPARAQRATAVLKKVVQMNKSKWLTLLGGMLIALFLILGLSPPGRASASVTLPDADRDYLNVAIQQAFLGSINTDLNGYVTGFNTYIVYDAGVSGSVYVCLSSEIDYFDLSGSVLTANLGDISGQCDNHGFYILKYCIGDCAPGSWGLCRGGRVVDSMVYGSSVPSDANFSLWNLSTSDYSTKILASNTSIKGKDGTVFFDRTPLAASWLKTADQAIQAELVEVRKNKPRLPRLGQIQTGLILVVCCLVSLVLLNKLLRVWHRSLIR